MTDLHRKILPPDMDPDGHIEATVDFYRRTPGEIRETLMTCTYERSRQQQSQIDPSTDFTVESWYVCPHCRNGRLKMKPGKPETCAVCGLEVICRDKYSVECVLRKQQ